MEENKDGNIIVKSLTREIKIVCFVKNISDCNPVGEFICSECGLIMRDLQRYEIDEDTNDESCYEFKFRYCPRCGRKVID